MGQKVSEEEVALAWEAHLCLILTAEERKVYGAVREGFMRANDVVWEYIGRGGKNRSKRFSAERDRVFRTLGRLAELGLVESTANTRVWWRKAQRPPCVATEVE